MLSLHMKTVKTVKIFTKGNSENFHCSLYHVLLKDILIVDPEDPVHRRNALVIIEKNIF